MTSIFYSQQRPEALILWSEIYFEMEALFFFPRFQKCNLKLEYHDGRSYTFKFIHPTKLLGLLYNHLLDPQVLSWQVILVDGTKYDLFQTGVEVNIHSVIERLVALVEAYFTILYTLLSILAQLWTRPLFVHRKHLKCLTMPWNICPALLVLWGVCWMFYNSPRLISDDLLWLDRQSLDQPLFATDSLAQITYQPLDLPEFATAGREFDQEYQAELNNFLSPSMFAELDNGSITSTENGWALPSGVVRTVPRGQVLSGGDQSTVQVNTAMTNDHEDTVSLGISVGEADPHYPTLENEKSFQCRQCDKPFKYRGTYERHVRDKHDSNATNRFLCPYDSCNRSVRGFARKDNLRDHLRRHRMLLPASERLPVRIAPMPASDANLAFKPPSSNATHVPISTIASTAGSQLDPTPMLSSLISSDSTRSSSASQVNRSGSVPAAVFNNELSGATVTEDIRRMQARIAELERALTAKNDELAKTKTLLRLYL